MKRVLRAWIVWAGTSVALVFAPPIAAAPVAVTFGTTGVGLNYSVPIADDIRLRGVVSAMQLDRDGLEAVLGTSASYGGIGYDLSFSGYTAGALLDYRPFRVPVRFSAGLLSMRPRLSFDSDAVQRSYAIGASTYVSDDLVIDGSAVLNRMGPYASVSWTTGSATSRGAYFTGELGVLYVGRPRVRLDATGTAVDRDDPSAEPFDIRSSADFLADLEAERRALERDVSRFRFWPIATLGFGYRF